MNQLTQTLTYYKDISNILKKVYDETVIEEIDIADIKAMLSEFSYDNVKILLNGNDILKKPDIIKAEPVSL